MKTKKYVFVICFLFIIVLLINHLNNLIIPKNYNRNIYSVIIHNTSKSEIHDIVVSYGRNVEDSDTLYQFCEIENLRSNEYKKINIDTTKPSEQAQIPYNVFVSIKSDVCKTYTTAGYFGKGTGGMAYVECNIEDKPEFKRIYNHTRKYKKMLKRHYKNQYECCWFD